LIAAARWKGYAPHTATGAASVRASHCQFVNCSAGIIDIRNTGTVSAVLMRRRRPSSRVSRRTGEPESAASGLPLWTDDACDDLTGGAGRLARYPAASTAAISAAGSSGEASRAAASARLTCAFSVA
jgi:hypothetical protein